ncbi:MAG TPA: DUF547 domain-containing protein [Xanthomonadales bacterium]|nr:DUF547 domain-containing protein [Xanthomonadales bacterium]
MKILKFALFFYMISWTVSGFANTAVPEPFRGHDPDSTFKIQYGDVDAILRTMVVDIGRSSRKKAPEVRAQTGTRMRNKVQRETATEGNRFYFEEFEDNEDFRVMLHQVRLNLEGIPSQVPLEDFNRTEQLAYWLNLHNITLIDELVKLYPENDLKKELNGRKSILDQKLLNVAGVELSLNDIRHTILPINYDNDPMVLYGLYQGVIGGPNIRKRAFTSENVRRYLQDNAEEFINSNRGTYAQDRSFEVSEMYERNDRYFPNFDVDLKNHLLRFIEGPERGALQAANTLDPDITDWTITDVYGSYQQIGGSFSDNKAAMMDSIVAVAPAEEGNGLGAGSGGLKPGGGQLGATQGGNMSVASSLVMAKTPGPGRFSPDVLMHINQLKMKEEETRRLKEGFVTVEELGEVEQEDASETEPEEDSDG